MLCLLSLSFCSPDEQPVQVDLSKKAEVSVQKDSYLVTYAYLPQYSHRVSYERHNPLIEYLKKETGLPIKQIFPDTFDEHMKMVGQGKIDISFSNPVAYVKMAHRYGTKAFARIIEEDGRAEFRGQIICRRDNIDIQTLEDCKGKRWIAVDPTSAGGYMYPLGHFYDHGIRKEDFAEIAFAPGPGGKQEKVVLAVYAGRYDIGSVREGTLEVVSDKVDISEIRVIATSRWYPGWLYSGRKGLAPEVVERIGKALLSLRMDNPDHQKIFKAGHMTGILPSGDQDYDSVRELLVKVGMDLDS
ncbi:MAG: phosphate/phosphite/phosphonate ABC transporter substrate-binding protein [Deltaproteobacteria bacterium]